ncbi:unnamed protein product [Symbiodinium microadriaticum]|nr:unnamed protein product [Symbiodinium microadriaticum]
MGNWPCVEEPGPGAPKATKVHESFFPMYLVKVSDFLAMEGVPESHDRLKQRGLLHEWNASMYTIFVSHQWLGRKHPDPTGEQVSVLRTALKRFIDGSLMIDLDVVSTTHGQENRFTPQTRQQVETGFLFFDWFAIPQITARAEGVNEEVTKSDAACAVKSIPAYVEAASLFIALVPFVPDRDRQEWCSYTTWLARGWCRAELWLHMLSSKPDTSVILVTSVTEAKFMFPLDWLENTIDSGDFTVEEDREAFRFYLARRSRMLGQNRSEWALQEFLNAFHFASLQEAATDQSSMNGLMCAVFSGDSGMIRELVGSRADVNWRSHGLGKAGYFDGQTILICAAKSHQPAGVLATLIELHADIHATMANGSTVLPMVRSPQQLEVIIRARADLNKLTYPVGNTPLGGACGAANSETIAALLRARCNPNPPVFGHGLSPLHSAIFFSRGNRCALKIVQLLLEHGANVNAIAAPTGAFRWGCQACRVYEAVVGTSRSSFRTRCFALLPGISPLGIASFIGDPDLVQFLLDFGADSSVPNTRGDFPEDLAAANGHLHLLPILLYKMWTKYALTGTADCSAVNQTIDAMLSALPPDSTEALIQGVWWYRLFLEGAVRPWRLSDLRDAFEGVPAQSQFSLLDAVARARTVLVADSGVTLGDAVVTIASSLPSTFSALQGRSIDLDGIATRFVESGAGSGLQE